MSDWERILHAKLDAMASKRAARQRVVTAAGFLAVVFGVSAAVAWLVAS